MKNTLRVCGALLVLGATPSAGMADQYQLLGGGIAGAPVTLLLDQTSGEFYYLALMDSSGNAIWSPTEIQNGSSLSWQDIGSLGPSLAGQLRLSVPKFMTLPAAPKLK